MKDYIIRLNSGAYMYGTSNYNELIELKNAFIKFKCTNSDSILEFNDTKGENIIDLKEVQAISIINLE